MNQNKITVEAEKDEIILRNQNNDYVIIPKKYRREVQDMIAEGCHNCLDDLISTLPTMDDYAEDGSVIPIVKESLQPLGRTISTSDDGLLAQDIDAELYALGGDPTKDGPNLSIVPAKDLNQKIPSNLISKDRANAISNPYNQATLTEEEKLEPITYYDDGVPIKSELPWYAKQREQYKEQFTKEWYFDNMLPKFSRNIGLDRSGKNWSKETNAEYDAFIMDKVADDLLSRDPDFENKFRENRISALNSFTPEELEVIKASRYGKNIDPSVWDMAGQGISNIVHGIKNDITHESNRNSYRNSGLTEEEAKSAGLGDVIGAPFHVAAKLPQALMYKLGMRPSDQSGDFTMGDALKGYNNAAPIQLDMATDASNLLGIGLGKSLIQGAGKLSKFGKLGKVAENVDDVADVLKNLPKLENIEFEFDIKTILEQIQKDRPLTDYEKSVKDAAIKYFEEATSPENFARAKKLDAEDGTEYVKSLKAFQKQFDDYNSRIRTKNELPFNIRLRNNPGDKSGGYSTLKELSPEDRMKNMIEPDINNREIVLNNDLQDIYRTVSHELKHHYTLGKSSEMKPFYDKPFFNKLEETVDTPGDVSKYDPEYADYMIQSAFDNSEMFKKSNYEYLSNPVEQDAYISTNFRDVLLKEGYIKNRFDKVKETDLVSFEMNNPEMKGVLGFYFKTMDYKDIVDFLNKGVYGTAGLLGAKHLMDKKGSQSESQQE